MPQLSPVSNAVLKPSVAQRSLQSRELQAPRVAAAGFHSPNQPTDTNRHSLPSTDSHSSDSGEGTHLCFAVSILHQNIQIHSGRNRILQVCNAAQTPWNSNAGILYLAKQCTGPTVTPLARGREKEFFLGSEWNSLATALPVSTALAETGLFSAWWAAEGGAALAPHWGCKFLALRRRGLDTSLWTQSHFCALTLKSSAKPRSSWDPDPSFGPQATLSHKHQCVARASRSPRGPDQQSPWLGTDTAVAEMGKATSLAELKPGARAPCWA